jgi:serine/threonine protein kinase
MPQYVDMEKIGSGGFGEVRKCRRVVDGQILAKKVLLKASRDAQKRFQREIRMLSKLDHPRIVKVVGAKLSRVPMWYVMPLYRTSLMAEIPNMIADEQRIRKLFGGILEGMQYAHEQGVLHRDLKPDNILLNSDDDLVVSDFGLGRALDADSTRATRTGGRLGTFGYTAPEQMVDAKTADRRADVFALGRILYELYTGDSPLTVPDLARLPPAIALIVEKCTKSDPAARFLSVAELRLAFENVFMARDKKTNEGKIKDFLAIALVKDGLSDDDIGGLATCVGSCLADSDLIRELCVKLPAPVFVLLWKHNPHVVRRIVDVFAQRVADQAWSFNYVDTLADCCAKIHRSLPDAKVRARVAYAIVSVAVDHNRWYAMALAAQLLMSATEPDEDLAIATALTPIVARVRSLADRLNKAKLGPNLVALIHQEEGDDVPF